VQDALGVAGVTIKVTTAKTKVAPPLRKAELRLVYRHGFAEAAELPSNPPAA